MSTNEKETTQETTALEARFAAEISRVLALTEGPEKQAEAMRLYKTAAPFFLSHQEGPCSW